MALNKIFMKRGFLNYLIFSGILFTNIINPNKSASLAQENIDIPKVISYRSSSCSCCKKWINHLRDNGLEVVDNICLLYTSPSPRDSVVSRMPSSA